MRSFSQHPASKKHLTHKVGITACAVNLCKRVKWGRFLSQPKQSKRVLGVESLEKCRLCNTSGWFYVL